MTFQTIFITIKTILTFPMKFLYNLVTKFAKDFLIFQKKKKFNDGFREGEFQKLFYN